MTAHLRLHAAAITCLLFAGSHAFAAVAVSPSAGQDWSGLWGLDLATVFGPGGENPVFTPAYAAKYGIMRDAAKAGHSVIGPETNCIPPGMPVIMAQPYPIELLFAPGKIVIIQEAFSQVCDVYMDGRGHSDDPDPTFNGDSIGHWEGDTLVVDTTAMTTKHHLLDDMGIPVSDQFHIVERIRMEKDGTALDIDYTMTDPENWDGEWKSSKRWKRQDHNDITEVECLPDLDEHLPSTHSTSNIN